MGSVAKTSTDRKTLGGSRSMQKIIGVDIGGTFTDLVLYDPADGTITVHKTPTTGANPSTGMVRGILELCQRADAAADEIGAIVHGTTIATNSLLQYDGARTGFLTTEGFRDILHIGRHQRPLHYSVMQDIPWQVRPLVRRRHRKTVAERIDVSSGEVMVALDENGVREAAGDFRRDEVEAVAVGFLASYVNPEHELRARQILEEELPGVFITTSSELFSQFREFERFTTAAINAFVGPKVTRYLRDLTESLAGESLTGNLRVMMSSGGMATIEAAGEKPATLLMSGPAAGVLGGKWCGDRIHRSKLITFDMGGTSADIGIVTERGIVEAPARDTEVAGYPLMVPMLDLHTVGAGGGSVAYVDSGGAFRVGPRSASARPGPACYGFGGEEPTVTDAQVVLGRIDPENFLGGEMTLDSGRSQAVVSELADRLGLSVEEAAEGIITIANGNMAAAIRSRTVQRGLDPREFSLVAFGGAGPLHAAELAESLDIPEVIIPPYPGINSAMGLLTTDLRYDQMHTVLMLSPTFDFDRVNDTFAAQAESLRQRLTDDGVAAADITIERGLDCRYVGQGYELRVAVPGDTVDEQSLAELVEDFHDIHEREYDHCFRGDPVEIVNLRTTAVGVTSKISDFHGPATTNLSAARLGTGSGLFRVDGRLESGELGFYDRWKIPPGEPVTGAAVIFQRDTTIFVPPSWIAMADETGTLTLTRRAEA
ncbi:MAG: hydantoinase/oxoprolinase family protein [Microbacteriaceae bacterium]